MFMLKKAVLLSGVMCIFALLATTAQASMVRTPEILADSSRTALLEKLESKDVQQQLIDMGVDPQSAIKRVQNMTDQEIAEINGRLEELPAGAGFSNLEVLLIVLLVVLLI